MSETGQVVALINVTEYSTRVSFRFIPKSKALAGIQFIIQILVNTDLNFPHDKVR